jgi:type I restriction enzyme, S subunit
MDFKEWKKYKLEDVIEALIDYRGKTPTKTLSGIPLITAKIVKNGFIQEPNEFIAKEDYESWMTRGFPQIGDVVLTVEAPLGEVAQIKSTNIALAQRIITLRGKKDVLDSGFLKYFLQSDIGQHRLKERETGTTVTGIKQSELRLVEIDCPDLATQTRIAAILSSLDDKIELNRQTNATLETIAQTLFKELCLVRNGENTEGGTIVKLEDLIDTISVTHKMKQEKIIFLNTSDILEGIFLHDNYSIVATLPGQAKKSIKRNDILFSEIRPANKRYAFVDFEANDYVVSTKLMVLRSKGKISPYLIYCFLTSNDTLNQLQHLAETRSGTFPQITFTQLKDMELIIPNDTKFNELTKNIESIYEKIFSNSQETQTLTTLRDSLLPKLMKGEIAV